MSNESDLTGKRAGRRPIDLLRNSGLVMNVGTDEDGPIVDAIPTEKKLYFVKSRAIYAVQLADQIDPERQNPSIPNTQQKELSVGSENPDVGRILLTAHKLFKKTALGQAFDALHGIELAVDLLKDVISLREKAERLEAELSKTVLPKQALSGPRQSFNLPCVENLDAQFDAFAQKAGHVVKGLGSLARFFYPQITSKWIDSLIRILKQEHGKTSHFWRYVERVRPNLMFVNEDLRNLIEHPKPDAFVKVHNFRLLPSGEIARPSLEIVGPDRPSEVHPIAESMVSISDDLVNVCEGILVVLCGSQIKGQSLLQLQVISVASDQRRHPHVRFSYGYYDGQTMVPIEVG